MQLRCHYEASSYLSSTKKGIILLSFPSIIWKRELTSLPSGKKGLLGGSSKNQWYKGNTFRTSAKSCETVFKMHSRIDSITFLELL